MTVTEMIQQAKAGGGQKAFRLERDGELAILWFDLPGEKVNKFTSWVMVELDGVLETIAASDAKKLLIASAKPGIFIAGADINEFTQVTSEAQAEEFIRYGQGVFSKLNKLPQITVAVINGACLGGGTELALACDYRVMSDSPKATMGLPEVNLGILPAWGGTSRLPRLIGIPAALDMILAGRRISGKRAKRMGLVDEVVPDSVLLAGAKSFVAGMKSKRKRGSKNTHLYLEGNPLGRKFAFGQARKATLAKTHGHYPAPLRVLEVMDKGFSKGLDEGLRAEASAASKLVIDPVSQNLVKLFFLMEEAKKDRGPAPKPVESAGVLGAGLMGAGIAQIITDKADINVRMKDVNWKALSAGMKSASKVWKRKVDSKRMTRGEMSRKVARLMPTTDWSGFRTVDLIVEAVLEKVDLKQQVLKEFEEIQKPGAIFATNTSTIPITTIAAKAQHPENVVGMHFFSPVDKMPLLEIIAGEKTSAQTLSTAVAFGKKIGKTVVVCKDGPGFIVNRILAPYMNEAGRLVQEGYSIDAIDKAMVDFGMPMGPLALLDEVGIDVAQKAGHVLIDAFKGRFEGSEMVDKLVADERLGKKNGKGVYRWKEGKKSGVDPSIYKLVGSPARKEAPADSLVERMVLAMVNEAALILDEKIADSAADVDLAMIMGTGFPPFRGGLLRYADTLGLPYIVARLNDLSEKVGPRFAPTEPIRLMAEQASTFYQSYPKI